MADNRVVAKIVSEFFLNTCLLRRPLNFDAVVVMLYSSRIVDSYAKYDNELDVTLLSQQELLLNFTLNRCCRVSVILT